MTQYTTKTDQFLNTNRHIYEVMMLANNANGDIVSTSNPLPVSTVQAADTYSFIKFSDSTNMQMDMTERLRVAISTQSWWYSPSIDKDGDLRYIESTTGTGSGSIFVNNLASISLGSGFDSNGKMIRISRRRHKMRPDVSMLASFSVNWNGPDTTNTVTKRVGLFTNFNGIFFEVTNDLSVVIRRRLADGVLVEKRVARNEFNVDRMDGTNSPTTNPSGLWITPEVHYQANITSYVSKTEVPITGDGSVFNVTYTVNDLSKFEAGRKYAVTGITPNTFNGTVMVSSVSSATGSGNIVVTYITDPGVFVSLSNSKLTNTRLHQQYVFGFDFNGSRTNNIRFFIDGPLGRQSIHFEDFSGDLSTPFSNAPSMSIRYEIFNTGVPTFRSSFLTSAEVINIEAESELNPGFGVAKRTSTLNITKGNRTEYAMLGIGLRAGEPYQRSDLQLQGVQIIDSGNVNQQNAGVFEWRLVLNPTFSGTAVPTPTNIGKSSRQWNYSLGTTISEGVTLLGGYTTSVTQLDIRTALNFLNLGSNIEYTDADKIILAIKMITDGTSDASLLATINFIEAL